MQARDITQQRFGRLVAIRRIANNPKYGQARWLFQCDCGNTTEQYGYSVWHGKVVSCGCRLRERIASGMHLIHGENGCPEHHSWASMRYRCNNKRSAAYHLYGGRGISICARWEQFANFLADMGRRPTPKHSLDRIDPDGNYEPANCRWADKSQQVRNRRVTLMHEHLGVTKALADWCDDFGLPYSTIWIRKKNGVSGAALFAPLRSCRVKQP